jgi:BirA family biotin operon repressor/biotin-[acetyl-CoA-carboxylase] ligase
MRASFDTGQVDAALAGTPLARQVHHVASTGSTNALALEAAQAGVATGVWLADEQTAGRGRSGHTWHSAAGDGLYVSVLLRPRLFGADALKLSLAAGLAAKHVVVEAGGIPAAQVDLRWPNDLMITGLGATGRWLMR